MPESEDAEDDYMTLTFDEPISSKESSIARTARLKREAAERGRIAPKAERAKQDEEKRSAGLATRLDSSNKGAKLMARMGYAGGALGAADNQGREDPVELSLKLDRGGIGMENEKKRKFREQAQANAAEVKRAKVTEEEYRERARREREESRAEGQWRGAMKVLEGLEEQTQTNTDATSAEQKSEKPVYTAKQLKAINVLYRPLVRDRQEAEQRRRDMKSLYEDRKRLDELVDSEQDGDDRLATLDDTVETQHEDDEELTGYECLPPSERLDKVVRHLRSVFNYCFWCKYQYEDATLEGCPGLTEDEHG